MDIYLNTLRIAQAKTLLAGTDLPVYRIGQLVGFPGEASFILLFKLKTGVTPEAYRENLKKELMLAHPNLKWDKGDAQRTKWPAAKLSFCSRHSILGFCYASQFFSVITQS